MQKPILAAAIRFRSQTIKIFFDSLRAMQEPDRILFAAWQELRFQPSRFKYDNLTKHYRLQPDFSAALANIANIHLNSSMKPASPTGMPFCVMFMPFGEGCEVTKIGVLSFSSATLCYRGIAAIL